VLAEEVRALAGGQDRVGQVDRDGDFAPAVLEQVTQREQVVRARGHHSQRVQVEADDVAQDHLQHIGLVQPLLLRVMPGPLDRQHEERARTARGIQQAQLRV